ncbi:MAG: EamA family transporter [Clostridia bacterium]|nr:EamA family transporter [Clostridia bacterium]
MASNSSGRYIMVVIAAVTWGMFGIISELLFSKGIDPISVGTYRATISFLLFFLFALIFERDSLKLEIKDFPFFILYGLIGVAGMYTMYTTAINLTSIATAAILLYTAPAFVNVLSYFIFKEPMDWTKIISLVLTLVGCFLVVKGYDVNSLKANTMGIIVGILSGITYAMFSIFGKLGSKKHSTLTLLVYSHLFGMLFMWFLRPPSFLIKTVVHTGIMPIVLALSIICTIIPNASYTYALKYIPASNASIIATLEPVIATIAGYFAFGQAIELPQIAGFALVILSIILVQTGKQTQNISFSANA